MTHPNPALLPVMRALSDAQRALVHGAALGVVLVLGAGATLVGVDAALWLAVAGYATGTGLALGLMRRGYPHTRLGLCNLVTLARLALASALLTAIVADADPWAVFAVAALALSLDGVDGWLARRAGLTSDFGARFDMEVDSALALILALTAWAAGTVGPLVLLIGLPRYAFAAATMILPWLARPAPERFSRKAACVIQIATLIALQLPPVGANLATPVVAAVALVLAWSFGRDILWLWRTRP
jgi:phosphatidylglycerophosphate synthase